MKFELCDDLSRPQRHHARPARSVRGDAALFLRGVGQSVQRIEASRRLEFFGVKRIHRVLECPVIFPDFVRRSQVLSIARLGDPWRDLERGRNPTRGRTLARASRAMTSQRNRKK